MALIEFHRGSSTGRAKRWGFCCRSKSLTASPIGTDGASGWKTGHVPEHRAQVRRMRRLEKPSAGLGKQNRWWRREEEITAQSPRQMESALI